MANGTCSIDGCGRGGALVRGWCQKHYTRWKRHRDPEFVKEIHGDTPRRFDLKVDRDGPGGCWLWVGTINGAGYGTFRVDGETVGAHRYAYETFVGTIPAGLQLDHLCRVRNCVNPAHLEPVTVSENVRRALEATA